MLKGQVKIGLIFFLHLYKAFLANKEEKPETSAAREEHVGQEFERLGKKLDAVQQHSTKLMEEKKVLEETLHREKLKCAATEQAMKDLEQQFADKERNWKVVEEEL